MILVTGIEALTKRSRVSSLIKIVQAWLSSCYIRLKSTRRAASMPIKHLASPRVLYFTYSTRGHTLTNIRTCIATI